MGHGNEIYVKLERAVWSGEKMDKNVLRETEPQCLYSASFRWAYTHVALFLILFF